MRDLEVRLHMAHDTSVGPGVSRLLSVGAIAVNARQRSDDRLAASWEKGAHRRTYRTRLLAQYLVETLGTSDWAADPRMTMVPICRKASRYMVGLYCEITRSVYCG